MARGWPDEPYMEESLVIIPYIRRRSSLPADSKYPFSQAGKATRRLPDFVVHGDPLGEILASGLG
jgi:hypothetical protein